MNRLFPDMERIEPVEMAMRSFAREALKRIQPEEEAHPGLIRIFCQKKIIDQHLIGGWGYFVIGKPKEVSPRVGPETQGVLDFYIYEEGK